MPIPESELAALLDTTWQAITAGRDVRTGVSVERPPLVPCEQTEGESLYGDAFPVLDHLDAAIGLARTTDLAPLAERFVAIADRLEWSQNPSYTRDNCTRVFLDGYAYAAAAGPDGPLVCAAPRGGFMLMGPEVTYPGHHHAPREVYLVLTPGAQWRLDDGHWFDVKPGDLIVHEPWTMHAMRTRGKPMLAFAAWLEAGDRRAIDWGASEAR